MFSFGINIYYLVHVICAVIQSCKICLTMFGMECTILKDFFTTAGSGTACISTSIKFLLNIVCMSGVVLAASTASLMVEMTPHQAKCPAAILMGNGNRNIMLTC